MELSKIEEYYVASFFAICEEVWLWKLLTTFFDLHIDVTCIFCDKQIFVNLSENLVFHDKSKHIEIKYHYIRDKV